MGIIVLDCPCGLHLLVKVWPLYCACGRVYGCDGQELEFRRGKPIIAKGKRPGG